MISKWQWLALQFTRRMWVRTSLFAVLGVLMALVAVLLEPFVPHELPTKIGGSAVGQILNIIASSMLVVTTFSLSTMVAAYSAATNNVTPRATRLLMQDTTTQNVLAVFIGSFLFSLVGIVALKTGYYGERGRFIMFIVTIGVIALVIVTILHWIEHLSRLGRVTETTSRVEEAAREAVAARRENPYLGARRLDETIDAQLAHGRTVMADATGYVQYVDMLALRNLAREADEAGHAVIIAVQALPGAFVHPARPLARMAPANGAAHELAAEEAEEIAQAVTSAFIIRAERTFEQDPRFGVTVLAEIASRALSPAVNDPGTAIDVLGRGMRVLEGWITGRNGDHTADPDCTQVYVPALDDEDLFEDFFRPIARDGAGHVEIQLRLQKALLALAQLGDAPARAAALHRSRDAMTRAEAALAIDADVVAVRAVANAVAQVCRDAGAD